MKISTQPEAVAHRFLGSPTVRVNGEDVEVAARGVTSYGFTCRVYRDGDEEVHLPPPAMVREAVRAAAAR